MEEEIETVSDSVIPCNPQEIRSINPLDAPSRVAPVDDDAECRRDVRDPHTNAVLGHLMKKPVNPNQSLFGGYGNGESAAQICWYCTNPHEPENLYVPCNCESPIHRECFRKWRTGWINPRNYFQCPNCMDDYNIERVKPSTSESEARIWRNFRCEILKAWLLTFLIVGSFVAAIALIAYYSDRQEKNIPVGVKYMLSSVVNGFPDKNSTREWREEFKTPDKKVWQYYTLLGCLCTSIVVLIGFCCLGCTFDEKERERKKRENCQCCRDCCHGGSSGNSDIFWCFYCSNCTCPRIDGKCCDNLNCEGGGGGGGDGAAIFLIVIVLIIAVAVILSGIFVVILYAVQKGGVIYARFSEMIRCQAQELEGETIVLGKNETWRPINAV